MKSKRSLCLLTLAIAVALPMAHAQDAELEPPKALVMENVPPVSAALAARVAKYTDFRPTGFSSWHPTKLEMLITRRHKNTPQVFRVSKPGAEPELMTDYPEPVRNAAFDPVAGQYIFFGKDSGGNEVFRGYKRALTGGEAIPMTPDGARVQDLSFSDSGKRMSYVTVPVNRQGSADKIKSTLYVADPANPESARKVAEFDGGGWFSFQFSPDEKSFAYMEYVSATESYIWTMDIATGAAKRLTSKDGNETVAYGGIDWAKDGKGLYTVTDRGSEFQRLTYIDLTTGQHTTISKDIDWDIASVDISQDGRYLAFVANEDGNNVLRIMTTADRKLLPPPKLPQGTIGGMKWHKNSTDIAFSVVSATSPSEVYSLNVKTGVVTRWTQHAKTEVDAGQFVEPELVRWKSFDGRMISGFLYRAPRARFPGKRPVIVNIHGGPEAQFQPGFLQRNNYFISELGISMIFPNVRGSAGYGKTFLKLDNGKLREDSVKDIGALFDWIAQQPDLDVSRIAVTGGSYGGYMSLAVSTTYPERIAAAIDIVGISNFVTFLEKTESYRRDLRRVEYGDERDPGVRKWMEDIAPLNRAHRIKKPLFVVQGKNDPRVPYQEADQIVATVKKNGTPVWYMTALDEGHGFGKKANADYQFYSTINFFERYLLGAK
jgi:dipeptidyl aminopeptidase/acylaminoacyl peptidase